MDDEEWMGIKKLTEVGSVITLMEVGEEEEIEIVPGFKAIFKRIK